MTPDDREWEVFVRETSDEPMTHVGSVSAANVDAARDNATALFGRFTNDLWLCPADAIDRDRGVTAP